MTEDEMRNHSYNKAHMVLLLALNDVGEGPFGPVVIEQDGESQLNHLLACLEQLLACLEKRITEALIEARMAPRLEDKP